MVVRSRFIIFVDKTGDSQYNGYIRLFRGDFMAGISLAVVGATGLVGRSILAILEERGFPCSRVRLLASARSAGLPVLFRGEEVVVEQLSVAAFDGDVPQIALFSAGGDISRQYAPILAGLGAVVIDNSSAWRMDAAVPLIVPEVNPRAIDGHANIIANPNCSTIQAVAAIAPLHSKYKIRRVVYSTYQAVSGAGQGGIDDLNATLAGENPKYFQTTIAGNVIPHIDTFLTNGYTREEWKMIEETRKILNAPNIAITATCCRVPVLNGHSISINLEFEHSFEMDELRGILGDAPGVVVYDDGYPTPLEISGRDEVFIGRIRRDESVPNGLNMWVCADNLRKGAALNAVQIAEILSNRGI